MSYCRWSDDDFQCDVYVYESCHGGYYTHVAGSRYVFKEPLPEPVSWSAEGAEAFFARNRKVSEMVEDAERVDIGLPHDGEDFIDGEPGACANRLEELRAIGYNVPQYAIDALRAEDATP